MEVLQYWIRLSDVYRLKMMLLRHLPLLVFGRDTSKFKAITPKERGELFSRPAAGKRSIVYRAFVSLHRSMFNCL